MRLARLLLISALAARAVADAAAPADEDPSRWSLRALTGGRYDAAAAARPADASPTRNVTNVQLWFHIMENFDEFSLFGNLANTTKFNESAKVLDACTFIPEGYYGPFDYVASAFRPTTLVESSPRPPRRRRAAASTT